VYIYQQPTWPAFTWQHERLEPLLGAVRHQQGRVLGHMEALGFSLQAEALLQTLTLEALKSSEIEGELLPTEQVRSSLARRLGLDVAGLVPAERRVEGVVDMLLDATQGFAEPLTAERLCNWQAALFPTGRSGLQRIQVGAWRTGAKGPMQVVSGPLGREQVHFEAPFAEQVAAEMTQFLAWFNSTLPLDAVLKAGIAHLWFVTIHPFEDGNGRVARALTELQLARADASAQRFYSLSAQIRA
jgi:Fic family protein